MATTLKVYSRYRGDTEPILVTITNKDTGKAIDISGDSYILSSSVDENPTAANYVFQLTGTIVDAEAGQVEFPIDETESDQLGTLFFDIQRTDSGGNLKTVMKAKFDFSQDITK